jgi:hypothetical protein
MKEFREQKLSEQAQRQEEPSPAPSPKSRQIQNATDIGMRLLYTIELDEDGNEIKIYQVLMLQDNFNLRNFYQDTICKLTYTKHLIYFLTLYFTKVKETDGNFEVPVQTSIVDCRFHDERAKQANLDIGKIPRSFLGIWSAKEKPTFDSQGRPQFRTTVDKRNYTVWVNETYDASGHEALLDTARILQSKIHEQTFTKIPYPNSVASSSSSSSQTFKANLVIENIFISDETCMLFDFFKVSDKNNTPVKRAISHVLFEEIPNKKKKLN